MEEWMFYYIGSNKEPVTLGNGLFLNQKEAKEHLHRWNKKYPKVMVYYHRTDQY